MYGKTEMLLDPERVRTGQLLRMDSGSLCLIRMCRADTLRNGTEVSGKLLAESDQANAAKKTSFPQES